jgi:peroxiredoxin
LTKVAEFKGETLIEDITDKEQLNTLINSRELVVVTTYRGDWCPFCRSYLKAVAKKTKGLPTDKLAVYGVSADTPENNAALKHKLGLSFELLSDPDLLFHKHWQAPINNSHGKARLYPQKAFLQPAVYIFKKGQLVFDWKQTPKLLNLGGAASRLSVDVIVDKIQQQLS